MTQSDWAGPTDWKGAARVAYAARQAEERQTLGRNLQELLARIGIPLPVDQILEHWNDDDWVLTLDGERFQIGAGDDAAPTPLRPTTIGLQRACKNCGAWVTTPDIPDQGTLGNYLATWDEPLCDTCAPPADDTAAGDTTDDAEAEAAPTSEVEIPVDWDRIRDGLVSLRSACDDLIFAIRDL